MTDTTRRDQYICAALTGLCAGRDAATLKAFADDAVAIADAALAAAWENLEFTVNPIASSLEESASDARELGLLDDPGDLSGLYDLRLLNDVLGALGRPAVEGIAP